MTNESVYDLRNLLDVTKKHLAALKVLQLLVKH